MLEVAFDGYSDLKLKLKELRRKQVDVKRIFLLRRNSSEEVNFRYAKVSNCNVEVGTDLVMHTRLNPEHLNYPANGHELHLKIHTKSRGSKILGYIDEDGNFFRKIESSKVKNSQPKRYLYIKQESKSQGLVSTSERVLPWGLAISFVVVLVYAIYKRK